MLLRVAAFHQLVLGDKVLSAGDTFEVADEVAANFLATGMVIPADGDWRGVVPGAVPQPPKPEPKPRKAKGRTRAECPCEPGPRPQGARASLQMCPVDGCQCKTYRGKCRAHARYNATGVRYRDSHNDGSSTDQARWLRASRAYLREHPWCEDSSHQPAIAAPPAKVVDHIDGLGIQGPRGFDETNLQALCAPCHGRKTARESFGH